MATINAATTAGVIRNFNSNYSTALSATTGVSTSVFPTSQYIGQAQISSTYNIYRAFMAFDVSGITAAPNGAILNIYVSPNDYADYSIVGASAPNLVTNLANADYNNNLGDFYSDSGFSVSTTGWKQVTLNTEALNNMNLLSILKLCIQSVNEGVAPTAISELDTIYFSGYTPYIEYTIGGYKQKIFSIPAANQGKIDTVLNSNVLKVIGTPTTYFATYVTTNADGCSYYEVDPVYFTIRYTSKAASSLIVGDIIYTNSLLTTPFNGASGWYGLGDNGYVTNSIQISSAGVILSITNCGF